MRGIIIEGISASGKSTILNKVQSMLNANMSSSTKLFISEHYTQRMLEHEVESGVISADKISKHIDSIINNLSIYQRLIDKSKFANRPSGAEVYTTIERFLLTFITAHPTILNNETFIKVAKKQMQKLSKLNIAQYVLILPDDKIQEYLTDTLKRRNKAWENYINQKGGITKMSVQAQDLQHRLLAASSHFNDCMKTNLITVADWNYDDIARTIYLTEFKK